MSAGRSAAWRPMPVLVLVLCIGLWVLVHGSALLRADMASQGARRLVNHWAARGQALPSPDELRRAESALRHAVGITPANAELHELLGHLQLVATRLADAAQDDAAQAAAFAEATTHYRAALARRPTDPQIWASLATALQGQGDHAGAHAAWARSLALGPHEGHVQPMLLELALRGWAQATPEMQAWALALYEGSAAPQQAAINQLAARHGLRFEPVNATPTPEVRNSPG